MKGDNRGKNADGILKDITELLDNGLKTETEPFPEDAVAFGKILDELRKLPADDIKGRLVIGGFVNHPYGPMEARCQECIYYLTHRKWCDIPELSLPVEPEWWCRLWKI